MDPKIVEVGTELSPIVVALIGATAGLISGVIASLIAPWVHYAIETKKKSLEYKAARIQEVRVLIDKSTTFKEIQSSSIWGFIESHLNEEERLEVLGVITKKTIVRYKKIPKLKSGETRETYALEDLSIEEIRKNGISKMLSRLEKEWKLIVT